MMNAPYLAVLSTRVPAPLRATVLQSLLTVNNVVGPLGYVLAGPLFDRVGFQPAYLMIAIICTLASINFVAAVRGVEDPRHVAVA